MKKRKHELVANIGAFMLLALLIVLAIDIAWRLYEPEAYQSNLPACALEISSGEVEVRSIDSFVWRKANKGMLLEPGSRIRTLPDSGALLSFSEGTRTKLEENTEMTISYLQGVQGASPDTIVLKQWAGKTHNQVARLSDDSWHFEIVTPSADAVVKGTVFTTEVDETGKTIIKTEEGRVDVVARGKRVMVMENMQTQVERGEEPSAPMPAGTVLAENRGGMDLGKQAEPNLATTRVEGPEVAEKSGEQATDRLLELFKENIVVIWPTMVFFTLAAAVTIFFLRKQ